MALSYPVSLANFSNRLRVRRLSLHAPTPVKQSQTAGGEIIRARQGATLWEGQCGLSFDHHAPAREIRVMLDLLMDAGASFLLSPAGYAGPASGSVGAGPFTLTSVAANNRDVTLGGLAASSVLTRGDYLSFTYGSNPVRYAFHQVVSLSAVASGGGAVTVEVFPPVQPGWSAGAVVLLKAPRLKAIVVDREAGESVRVFHDGMSFTFRQVLR